MVKFIFFIAYSICLISVSPVSSQSIIPNNKIPSPRDDETEISAARNSRNSIITITGGAERNDAVFHSFKRFNILEGQTVKFQPQSSTIRSVFSRVTGDEVSRILGTLGVTGNADLFFLNPNGIVFGAGASLDLNGDFVATTADSFEFGNGFEFGATNPQPLPGRLQSDLPFNLNFRGDVGSISAQPGTGLRVEDTQSLVFLGGDISVHRNLSAIGGRIEIISFDSGSSVTLKRFKSGISWEFDNNYSLRDVIIFGVGETVISDGGFRFINENTDSTDFIPGGVIRIIGRHITLNDVTLSSNSDFQKSGGLTELIATDSIRSNNLSISRAIVDETPIIKIIAPQVQLSNTDIDIAARSLRGTINISADKTLEINNTDITAGSFDEDGAGSITLNTSKLLLHNGSEIISNASASGDAGNIFIGANSIHLADSTISTDSVRSTAGNITIKSEELILNNAFIQSNTSGNEGNINLHLEDLIVKNNSEISTDASNESNGGDIRIDVDNLVALDNGDISADANQGSGGFIEINALGVFGTAIRDKRNLATSDITARSEFDPELDGDVDLNTPDLNPANNLEPLPETVINPETLVSASPCPEDLESEFVIEGSGGVPTYPGTTLTPDGLNPAELSDPVTPPDRQPDISVIGTTLVAQAADITPAWGWVWNDDGEVLLTAYDPTAISPQRLPSLNTTCSKN